MTHIVDRDELPNNGSVYKFEGHLYGDANVSFFLSDTAPGKGPGLHKHPYEIPQTDFGEYPFHALR